MPRLVKGGKFVYGLSRIRQNGEIVIPLEAMKEYGYKEGDIVIILRGSRKSGGFGLTTKKLLEKSRLCTIMEILPELMNFWILEGETIGKQGRLFCRTKIRKGGSIRIPPKALCGYSMKPGDLLAVVKGSYLVLAFVDRGLIVDEALKHPELEMYGE